MDYSEEMIERARQFQRQTGIVNVKFCVGDFEDLHFKSETFDTVITMRSITNLPSWQSQRRAISELIRVLRQGGRLLMSEPSQPGLARLNRTRAAFRLQPIPPPWYNLYFDDEVLLGFIPIKER